MSGWLATDLPCHLKRSATDHFLISPIFPAHGAPLIVLRDRRFGVLALQARPRLNVDVHSVRRCDHATEGPVATEVAEVELSVLLSRLRHGDRAAFDRLVDVFWDPVMRYFWKRLPAQDAEDQTQEVFIQTYEAVRRGGGSAESTLPTWRRYLFASARNRLIDYWRRKGARPPTDSLEDLLAEERSWEEILPDYGTASTGAAPAISAEQGTAVHDCMGALDVTSRALCWLVFADERPKRDIARLIGKPESSVRVLITEAVQALRRCLESKGLGPDVVGTVSNRPVGRQPA